MRSRRTWPRSIASSSRPRSRYQVGLVAITDVQEARAAHDSGAAAVIASKRQLASAQELLREITGDVFDYLARPIEPFELANPDPSSEDRWVEMALQQNLSLVSSRLAADIARENVSAARGGHLPSLDLVASRYRATSDGVSTNADNTPYGSTSLDQYQNVIGIQFTFPIYSGGMVSSQVRQAVYQHRAAKERLERVARQTEHDARDAYLGVLSEISHVQALRRALESNVTALNATESGYEAGTRTAVDVLASRRLWMQAQTDYSRSRYDYMINVLKLQQAAGILSEQSLNRLNGLLKDSPDAVAPQPVRPHRRRLRQQGIDELEQPRDAPAMRVRRTRAHGRPPCGASRGRRRTAAGLCSAAAHPRPRPRRPARTSARAMSPLLAL